MKLLKSNLIFTANLEKRTTCKLYANQYRDTLALALRLVMHEHSYEEPLTTVSCNLPTPRLALDEFFCKDWGENVGMVEWLEENQIATRTGKTGSNGYVTVEVMRLTPEISAILTTD